MANLGRIYFVLIFYFCQFISLNSFAGNNQIADTSLNLPSDEKAFDESCVANTPDAYLAFIRKFQESKQISKAWEFFGKVAELQDLPSYVKFSVPKKVIREILGGSGEERKIKIGGANIKWEYLYYADKDLLFEAIGDCVFEVHMGKQSKGKAHGIGIGDKEELIWQVLAWKKPEIRQFGSWSDLPITIYADPNVNSDALYRAMYSDPNSHKTISYRILAVSKDWRWIKIAHFPEAKTGIQGWIPLERSNCRKYIWLEYKFDFKDHIVTYRVREGRITLIRVFCESARFRHIRSVIVYGQPMYHLEGEAAK